MVKMATTRALIVVTVLGLATCGSTCVGDDIERPDIERPDDYAPPRGIAEAVAAAGGVVPGWFLARVPPGELECPCIADARRQLLFTASSTTCGGTDYPVVGHDVISEFSALDRDAADVLRRTCRYGETNRSALEDTGLFEEVEPVFREVLPANAPPPHFNKRWQDMRLKVAGALASGGRRRPVLVGIIDTQNRGNVDCTDDLSTIGGHAGGVGQMIAGLAEAPGVTATFCFESALPLSSAQSTLPAQRSGSFGRYVTGDFGTAEMIAEAIIHLLSDLDKMRQSAPDTQLVLNLSLGWTDNASCTGGETHTIAKDAVAAALRLVAEAGGHAIGAFGNRGGRCAQSDAAYPAALYWEDPDLIVPVGAVDFHGRLLATMRAEQMGRAAPWLAPGAHRVATGKVWSGTSIAAAAASAMVAVIVANRAVSTRNDIEAALGNVKTGTRTFGLPNSIAPVTPSPNAAVRVVGESRCLDVPVACGSTRYYCSPDTIVQQGGSFTPYCPTQEMLGREYDGPSGPFPLDPLCPFCRIELQSFIYDPTPPPGKPPGLEPRLVFYGPGGTTYIDLTDYIGGDYGAGTKLELQLPPGGIKTAKVTYIDAKGVALGEEVPVD